MEPLCDLFDASPTELLNTDTLILDQKTKSDYAQNNGYNGYIINQLSEKLIDQYEARIAEKDAALTKQDAIINKLEERLKKEHK